MGTTQLRALGSISYGNMFGRLDTLSLQYQTAPENQDNAKVIAAIYNMNVGHDRGQLAFSYIDSDSAVATVGTLGVLGTGKTYGVHFTQPMRSSVGISDSFSVGLDYKRSTQDVLVDQGPGVNTPINYLNSSFSYSGFTGFATAPMELVLNLEFWDTRSGQPRRFFCG